MAKFEIVIFEDSSGRLPFLTWADRKLNDSQFASMDAAISHVLAEQGAILLGTNWLKSVSTTTEEGAKTPGHITVSGPNASVRSTTV